MLHSCRPIAFVCHLAIASIALGQGQTGGDRPDPGGPPPFGSRGGPGGPNREELKILEAHDLDGSGWLDQDERAAARETLAEMRASNEGDRGRGRRGPGGRGPRGRELPPATPGPKVAPEDVEVHPDASLYDSGVLRTIFLNFENEDWEAELQDFHGTDVEVPAEMIVDGRTYPGVGVGFRGASSYLMVPAGHKRSFNVSIDLVDEDQRLFGYKTLNLLNGNGDPSMMSTVLYSELAARHLAVPKANFVEVVVNGESWGVYVNVQQFDRIFTAENYGSSKGTRWKVPGSPRGDGGLAYDGDDLEPYRARYEMKSNDGDKAWTSLVELCRILDETPLEGLSDALEPILDLDDTLWFLAYDVALVNSDGYWTRASDYALFRDANGRFHPIPHDMNESFRTARGRGPRGPGGPGGPGGFGPPPGDRRRGGPGGGPGGGGPTLDPLVGLDRERFPLRSRLLAVPELRERYLAHIAEIARVDLDPETFGDRVARHRALLEDALRRDTRKLDSFEAFIRSTSVARDGQPAPPESLTGFATARRNHLLNTPLPSEDASSEETSSPPTRR